MAEFIAQVGTGVGRDYVSVDAWLADIPDDIISDGNIYWAVMHNDSEFSSSILIPSTKLTNSSCYLGLRAASGQAYFDNPDVRTNPYYYDVTKGVGIRVVGEYSRAMRIEAPFTRLRGLQIYGQGTAQMGLEALSTATDLILDQCMILGQYRAASIDGPRFIGDNLLVVSLGAGNNHGMNIVGTNSKLRKSTIVAVNNSGTKWGLHCEYADTEVVDVLVSNFSECFRNTSSTITGSNNASSDATAPGGNSLHGIVHADTFESTTSDFRLKYGADVIDAGVAVGSAVDASNSARPIGAAYDIGAWEFGSFVPPDPPTATVTDQSVPDGQTVTITLETEHATSGTITFTGSDGGETRTVPFTVEDDAAVVVAEGLVPGHYELSGEVTGPGGTASIVGLQAFDIVPVSGGGEIDPGGGGGGGGGIGFIDATEFISFI